MFPYAPSIFIYLFIFNFLFKCSREVLPSPCETSVFNRGKIRLIFRPRLGLLSTQNKPFRGKLQFIVFPRRDTCDETQNINAMNRKRNLRELELAEGVRKFLQTGMFLVLKVLSTECVTDSVSGVASCVVCMLLNQN